MRLPKALCCSVQSRTRVGCGPADHSSTCIIQCQRLSHNHRMELSPTPIYKTVPAFAETISTDYLEVSYQCQFCNRNHLEGPDSAPIVILNTKLGLWPQDQSGENLQVCLISPPKELLQELDALWWRGWWAGSVTQSQSCLLSQARWVPCLCRNVIRSSRTPGAWWV